VFQVYQTIGRSLCAQARPAGGLVSDIARKLGTELDTFNTSWQLSSGLCMERLWTAFRPATAKNLIELDFSLHVKRLAYRFDALKWSSGASVRELEILQNSIVNIHNSIRTTSPADSVPLAVCWRSAVKRGMLMIY